MNTYNPYLLYAITDPGYAERMPLEDQVEAAIRGGITCLQLRDKTADKEEFRRQAISVKKLTDAAGIPLIVNDHVDIAAEIDAAGVHIGQKDMALTEARAILGPDKIIGVSARTVELALKAQQDGASYLGVGAVFGTTTKLDAKPLEMETLKSICAAVSIPVVAIGGISQNNVEKLAGTGISGAAVVSAVFGQPDIEAACIKLLETLKQVTA